MMGCLVAMPAVEAEAGEEGAGAEALVEGAGAGEEALVEEVGAGAAAAAPARPARLSAAVRLNKGQRRLP